MPDNKSLTKQEFFEKCRKIAQENGDYQCTKRKEINDLQKVLKKNEEILALTSGYADAITWLITLTDKRIIFIKKDMLLKLSHINLNNIESVPNLNGKISFQTGGKTKSINSVPSGVSSRFIAKMEKALEEKKLQTRSSPMSDKPSYIRSIPIPPLTPYEELTSFVRLKDEKVIDEKEFNLAKKRIIEGG